MNDEIFIPQDITKWGIITAFLYFGMSFIAYKYKCYLLSLICLCVFITSILHWYRQTLSGLVKIVDMFFAGMLFILFTFYYTNILFKDKYKKIWYITAILIILSYILNSIIIHFQVIKKSDKYQQKYNYFSLEYTKPDSEERTMCYYYTTFIHLCFQHILPTFVAGFFTIISTF
jgi:hypothetical protein